MAPPADTVSYEEQWQSDILSFLMPKGKVTTTTTESYSTEKTLPLIDGIEYEFIAVKALHERYMDKYNSAPDKFTKQEQEQAYSNAHMLYFMAQVLLKHYRAYKHEEKIALYQTTVDTLEIDVFKIREKQANGTQHATLNAIKNAANNLIRASFYRDIATVVNLQRIYWIFCRLTMVELEAIFGSLKGFEQAKNITHAISLPSATNNILSVGIFALRLVYDISMILKHTFFASADEAQTTYGQRAWYELKKRASDMVNNILWGVVNLITNYGKIFGINDITGGYIIAGLLIFDVALVSIKRLEARKKYLAARSNLEKRLSEAKGSEKDLINKQIQALDDDWIIKSRVFHFNSIAAGFLFAAWTASLFVPPVGALVCFTFVMLGVAMYMSSNHFGAYEKAKMSLKHAINDNAPEEEIAKLKQQVKQARRTLIFSITEKTIAPLTILLTMSFCWPAGVGVLAAYIAFKIGKSIYNKHQAKKKSSPEVPSFFAEKHAQSLPSKEDEADIDNIGAPDQATTQ